jgi:hypothetical protein
MSLSLAEAASLTGLNKTTLLRSVKSGRMTGTKDALGQCQVAEAELLRVYQPSGGAAGERSDTRHDAAAALQAEVNGLKQVAELLRRELDECALIAITGAKRRLSRCAHCRPQRLLARGGPGGNGWRVESPGQFYQRDIFSGRGPRRPATDLV